MASVISVLRVGVLFGCLAIGASAAISQPLRGPCQAPEATLSMNGRLDRAARRLNDPDGFKVLVIGSSSTAGVGATSPDKTYTSRLQDEMEQRLTGVDVTVVARGVGGETAAGADARLAKEIAAARPDLVVWQIGTNDAERGVDVAAFEKIAAHGLALIASTGVDVAMLDPQFVPGDEAQYAPYIAALNEVSVRTGVPLARRFEAMRAIAKAGGSALISRDNLHMNDAGHACVAAFLAEALDRKLEPLSPAVAETGRQS